MDERPREKLKEKGAESLSIEELIAILLRTGNKEESVKDLAIKIMNSLQDINELNTICLNDLIQIKGIKEAKAITLLAAIELGKRLAISNVKEKAKIINAETIFQIFRPKIIGLKQEKLFALFLNTKNELIHYEVVFIGTQNKSVTHPREIFYYAIRNSAMKIIIMHNHPSNDTTPSEEDIAFTNRVKEVGETLQIPVIDHIILGETNYFSFFDHHLL